MHFTFLYKKNIIIENGGKNMAKKIQRDPKDVAIANAIMEQYSPETKDDVQDALKRIFGFLKQIPSFALSFNEWSNQTCSLLQNYWNLKDYIKDSLNEYDHTFCKSLSESEFYELIGKIKKAFGI